MGRIIKKARIIKKMITLARQHIPGGLRAAGPFSSPSPSPEFTKGSHWSNVSPTDVQDGVATEGGTIVAAPADCGEVADFPCSSHSSIINDDAARLDELESSSSTVLSDEDGLLITPAEDETDKYAPSSPQETTFTSSLTTDEIKKGDHPDITSVLALYKSCSQRGVRLNLFSRENSDSRDSSVSFLGAIETELSQFRRFKSAFD